MSGTPFSNVNNIHVHSMILEDQKNMTTQWCSFILFWRNHLKAQPPRSVLIGAKTERQRFDFYTILLNYVENTASGLQNTIHDTLNVRKRNFDINNWILITLRRIRFTTERSLRHKEVRSIRLCLLYYLFLIASAPCHGSVMNFTGIRLGCSLFHPFFFCIHSLSCRFV